MLIVHSRQWRHAEWNWSDIGQNSVCREIRMIKDHFRGLNWRDTCLIIPPTSRMIGIRRINSRPVFAAALRWAAHSVVLCWSAHSIVLCRSAHSVVLCRSAHSVVLRRSAHSVVFYLIAILVGTWQNWKEERKIRGILRNWRLDKPEIVLSGKWGLIIRPRPQVADTRALKSVRGGPTSGRTASYRVAGQRLTIWLPSLISRTIVEWVSTWVSRRQSNKDDFCI